MAVVLGLMGVLMGGRKACGQGADVPASVPSVVAPVVEDEQPAPSDTMAAYRLVDEWVRAWKMPSEEEARQPRARGVCVMLRLGSQMVGKGLAIADDVVSAGGGDARVLARAARAAMEEAQSKLPVPNDALRDDAIRQLSKDIEISVELAGRFTPIEPATWAETALGLAPGLDGIAVQLVNAPQERAAATLRNGARAVFPSTMLQSNLPPHRAIAATAAQLIGEGGAASVLDEPKAIRDKHGLRMMKFRVSHLGQCGPGKEPEFLFRGSRLVPWQRAMTRAELEKFAESLMLYIARQPLGKSFENSRTSSLIGALALVRGVEALPKSGVSSAVWARAVSVCEQNLETLASAELTDLLLTDRLASDIERVRFQGPKPMMIASGMPHGYRLMWPPVIMRTDAMWREAEDASATLARLQPDALAFGADIGDVPPPALALRAFSYLHGQRCTQARPPGDHERLHAEATIALLEKAWRSTEEGDRVSLLPWYGWALMDCDVGEMRRRLIEPWEVPVARLRELRTLVLQHQIGVTGASTPLPDMIGGISFTAGANDSRASSLAGWSGARPLGFLATMLRDNRLTESTERATQLVRVLNGLRFLRQLQVDDSNAWIYDEPARAMGGIRASAWDKSLPLDASSMTLLCVTEALTSLKALENAAKDEASAAARRAVQTEMERAVEPPAKP